MGGLKLWNVPTPDGKLTPELIDTQMFDIGSVHRAQPGVISITNTTELGTLYTAAEIKALADYAHKHNLLLHLDGARLSNAAAALGMRFKQFTTDVGVDIVSFGATKIGAMAAESVVVLNPDLVNAMPFLRKTSMQLASKMRFVSAQIIALLENDLWRRNGEHANAMAKRLDAGLRAMGVEIPNPTEANAVFPIFTEAQTAKLQESYRFYVWNYATGQVRLMCAWDTTEADVDGMLAAVKSVLA
jgi:threonine aldolase